MKTLSDPAIRTALIERVKTVKHDRKPLWGRMDAPQMQCHLTDAFRFALGEKSATPSSGLFQRTVMKSFALYVPLHWPRNIKTMPEMDQYGGGTPPARFADDRRELIQAVDRFCRPDALLEGRPHPIFGPLKEWEWRRWGYLHMDHHLRQFGA